MNDKYDIAIAYRIYPGVSKAPPIHSDDKFKLSELCLSSLKSSLGHLKVKFFAILDNCPKEYERLFRKYFDGPGLEIMSLPGIGNNGTWKKQVEILLEQKDSEYVFFAEDDYFYLPDNFNEMIEILKTEKDVDFVTPYDHLDYYNLPLHNYKSDYRMINGRRWRNVSTTCMTFMTTKKALRETKDIFLSYSRRNDDASLWLALTKMNIFNPSLYFRFLLTSKPMFKIFAKAWFFCSKQLFFGKKRVLLAPEPSLGTHMDDKYLAPGIDWQKKFSEID